MKLVIVTNSDMYEDRAARLREFFLPRYEVAVLSTDFLHVKKIRREQGREGFRHLPTKPYRKNISAGRLLSHYDFARRAFAEVEREKPDILYVMLPANSLAHFARLYKKKHPEVFLALDVIDLWPESFPLAKFEKTPPFRAWRKMRDRALPQADYVVTECDLYAEKLAPLLDKTPHKTLRLAKEPTGVAHRPSLSETEWDLCYLGSVNNIIDIPFIASVVRAFAKSRPVTVHIVGKGERMEELLAAVREAGGRADLLGAIYDAAEKQAVFDRCHFGLNIMRPTVCVGLTMKSMDYFECGLPLLNTIPGDTARFVSERGAGRNVSEKTLDAVAAELAERSTEELLTMREAALSVHRDHLTPAVFLDTLTAIESEWEKQA